MRGHMDRRSSAGETVHPLERVEIQCCWRGVVQCSAWFDPWHAALASYLAGRAVVWRGPAGGAGLVEAIRSAGLALLATARYRAYPQF